MVHAYGTSLDCNLYGGLDSKESRVYLVLYLGKGFWGLHTFHGNRKEHKFSCDFWVTWNSKPQNYLIT